MRLSAAVWLCAVAVSPAAAASGAFAPAAPAPFALESAFASAAGAAASANAREKSRKRFESKLADKLGPFAALLAQGGQDEAWMSAEIVRRLVSGSEKGLVLGESHSDRLEISAGLRFLQDTMAAGVRFKALVRETNTFTGDDLMARASVAVTPFRTPFAPRPEIVAALNSPGAGLVATYSGHAHTSTKLKDYCLKTLEEAAWLRIPDMPTIEDAYRGEGKRPLIVAMITERRILQRIQYLLLRELSDKKQTFGATLEALEDLRAAWNVRVPQAAPARTLRFLPYPGEKSVYVGLGASPRSPGETEALIEVMSSPEARDWAGAAKLKSFEATWGSSGDETGRPVYHYDVTLNREGAAPFKRTIQRAL